MLILLIMMIVNFNTCSNKKTIDTLQEKKIETNHSWTDTVIGPYYVRIHSPEPGDNPGIWEGPIEIGKKPGVFGCRVDTSLIRGVKMGPENNILVIEAFSGNELYTVEVNVDSCIAAMKKE